MFIWLRQSHTPSCTCRIVPDTHSNAQWHIEGDRVHGECFWQVTAPTNNKNGRKDAGKIERKSVEVNEWLSLWQFAQPHWVRSTAWMPVTAVPVFHYTFVNFMGSPLHLNCFIGKNYFAAYKSSSAQLKRIPEKKLLSLLEITRQTTQGHYLPNIFLHSSRTERIANVFYILHLLISATLRFFVSVCIWRGNMPMH